MSKTVENYGCCGVIVLLTAIAIFALFYYYPGWFFILLLTILVVVYFLVKWNKESKEKLVGDICSYLGGCVIIDSNIWMDKNYDEFFSCLKEACKRCNYTLELYGPQFDEITNIKKEFSFGSAKNSQARLAISRIEDFQKEGLLRIRSITIDSVQGTYFADPLIIQLLISQAKEGVYCTFISNNIELRIRVRQYLKNFAVSKWSVLEISDISQYLIVDSKDCKLS